MGTGLTGLADKFKIGYQASTLFSAFFSAFTVGQFLKSIYDANIQLLKLQKAMLFTTGSFADAEKATDRFIALADDLGLSLDKTTEAYARFTISAKATGIDVDASNKIFKSVATALQVALPGAFVACSNYPDCKFTRRFGQPGSDGDAGDTGPEVMGQDPETGAEVTKRRSMASGFCNARITVAACSSSASSRLISLSSSLAASTTASEALGCGAT